MDNIRDFEGWTLGGVFAAGVTAEIFDDVEEIIYVPIARQFQFGILVELMEQSYIILKL